MVLPHAQRPLLHGAMVVASGDGDGDGDNGGGGSDSDARHRIDKVGKHDARS
jgi:hypothetical protein